MLRSDGIEDLDMTYSKIAEFLLDRSGYAQVCKTCICVCQAILALVVNVRFGRLLIELQPHGLLELTRHFRGSRFPISSWHSLQIAIADMLSKHLLTIPVMNPDIILKSHLPAAAASFSRHTLPRPQ